MQTGLCYALPPPEWFIQKDILLVTFALYENERRGIMWHYTERDMQRQRRVLTHGEIAVLTLIQQGYGGHNGADTVFFTPAGKAVIFVRLANGMSIVMANLSNLAARRADGSISSDDELKTRWLRLDK